MGGGGGIGGVVSGIGKGLGAIATGGTSLIPGSPTKRIGDVVGGGLTLNPNMIESGLNMSSSYTPQLVSQNNDPLSVLTQTGGAPLLASVAMGVSPKDALAGYFGQSAQSFDGWLASQDQATQNAINGVSNQLNEIQTNTNKQNSTIQKLVQDFPNYMQSQIPKYASIMSDATKNMMDQAIQGAAAKYAPYGSVSSGAMNEAAAKIGAQYAEKDIQYGTDLAGADFTNQYNEANALRTFQQKMLGQTSEQGFSAQQAALQRQLQIAGANTGAINQANAAKAANNNALIGGLTNTAGNILGLGLLKGGFGGGGASAPSGVTPSSPSFPQGDTSMNMPLNYPSAGGYR